MDKVLESLMNGLKGDKLFEVGVFNPPSEEDIKKRKAGIWELKKPLRYSTAFSTNGEIVANFPPGTDGFSVHVLCEFSSDRVYDSVNSAIVVKKVVIKNFKVVNIVDEFGVIPDGMRDKVRERVEKDKNEIQMVLQDRLMQEEDLG